MRRGTKWALAGGGAAVVAAVIGFAIYESHKAGALTSIGGRPVPPPAPVGPHTTGNFNPNLGSGGATQTVPLQLGQVSATVSAHVGDIIDIVFAPGDGAVSSATYGQVQWGTGADPGSKQVSVQVSQSTVVTVTWSSQESGAPVRYTTAVKVNVS